MNEQLNRRLAFLGILIIGLFAALFTRAWYLQVLTADELSEKARANYVEIVIAEPTRGRILDRHGVVLADNIRSGVITVNQSRYAWPNRLCSGANIPDRSPHFNAQITTRKPTNPP